MIGNVLERPFHGIETDLGITMIVVTEIDAAVVGSPLRVLDIAVEFVRKGVRIGAIAIHEVKLGGLMALVTIIVAGVGDKFSVGRDRGRVDRKSTRLNSSHRCISYAVFCLNKK